MKEALLSAALLFGVYALLFLVLPEREEVKRAVSLLFSAILLLVLFRPFLTGEFLKPLEGIEGSGAWVGGVSAGESYLAEEEERAVCDGIRAALCERFLLAKEEVTVTAMFGEPLTPVSVTVTLNGKSALSDLVGIERYGKSQICENFEVHIFERSE